MAKQIEDVNEMLDNLMIRNLELMEERVAANIEMENSLRNGQIELAKTRLIRGKESIGALQIPIHADNIEPMFELETNLNDNENGNATAQFDISLKEKDNDENVQNPLKWFGILVPQNLKMSQKYFQEAIYQSVKIANIQAEHIAVLNEIKVLQSMKDKLCSTQDLQNERN